MKKNKGLIIGVILFIIAAAVAAWYFFFRTTAARVVEEVIDDTPPDKPVAEPPTPAIFAQAIIAAKQDVLNNQLLTSDERSRAVNIIDVFVTKDSSLILADAATGKDIVQLILIDAEKIYLVNFKVPIVLSSTSRATQGKG